MSTIRNVPDEEMSFYKQIPKIHMHCHVLGMVPAQTLIDLANKHGIDIGEQDPEKIYRYYDFRRLVELLSAVASVMVDEEDFCRVIYEIIAYAYKEEHVLYSELFIQPVYHMLFGRSYKTIVDGFAMGIEKAEKEFGVKTRLILGLNRQLPGPMAVEIVRNAIAYPSPYVIGVGLEDFEGFGPPEDFAKAYALAKSAGLHRTAHAGEQGSPMNVIKALTILDCERIDHGYLATTEPSIIYRLAENQVHFTTCPSVAARQGWLTEKGHVIKTMYSYGLWISIDSDDPAIMGTNLNREYALAAKFIGISRDEMIAISRRSIDASWLSEGEKEKLRKRFDEDLKQVGR